MAKDPVCGMNVDEKKTPVRPLMEEAEPGPFSWGGDRRRGGW